MYIEQILTFLLQFSFWKYEFNLHNVQTFFLSGQ